MAEGFDPMFENIVLLGFKLACDTNVVYENTAMWLFLSFMKGSFSVERIARLRC